MKLTSWSRAWAMMALATAASVRPPNIIVPRQISETRNPLLPRFLKRIDVSLARCSVRTPQRHRSFCIRFAGLRLGRRALRVEIARRWAGSQAVGWGARLLLRPETRPVSDVPDRDRPSLWISARRAL